MEFPEVPATASKENSQKAEFPQSGHLLERRPLSTTSMLAVTMQEVTPNGLWPQLTHHFGPSLRWPPSSPAPLGENIQLQEF